ncbi:related to Malic acid transport protein [Pseudozyma flocculosa]|uniref:Related to Malic acid transport protein n=2 Tax=Pseudozyma flocculosa TaxID=84751 RepID=A0A5C3EYX0_9BASI|nr:related to Malic acid transport protein [Pseudozyma flocculosa]
MGTGITAILLHQLPYQFDGLETISNVIFALNVVLFALILALSIARYVIWPSMFWTMLYHPTQSLFLGTFPMGFTTIINMMVYSLVPAWGSGWLTAAHVLWWIDSAVAIVIAIGIPFVQFTRHSQSFDNISGVWFLPVVTTVVAAATGGTVASALIGAGQVDEARVVVVASYILWGTGVPLSMMLMTLYYARLAIYKIPPAAMIVSAFLPLGPCGQGAFGLLQLAADLVEITRLTGSFALGGSGGAPGRGLDSESAHLVSYAMQGASILVALVIWGVGLVWLVLAVATIADMTAASFVPFNMGWWGYTFPLGTFATATTQLGRMLDSRAFLVLGTVLSAIVALLWLGLFVVTGWKAVTGTMFFSPCLAEQGGSPPVLVAPARKYAYSPRPPSQTRGASSLSPLPFNRSRNRSGARDASHDHHRDGVPRGPIERVLEVFIRDKSQDADRDADADRDRGRSQTRLDRSGGGGGGGGLQDDVVGGAGEVRTAEVRR